MKKAANAMISLTANVSPAIMRALAARNLPRRGTAVRLVLMAPVEYSEVMITIPSTPIASWASSPPAPLIDVGSHKARLPGVSWA